MYAIRSYYGPVAEFRGTLDLTATGGRRWNAETQEVANYLPEWSRARYDKFSNFQQIVNGFGKYLHKLEKTIDLQTSNYFVQTSNMNELANVYKVQLDGSFEFKSNVKGDGEEYIVPPEVIARDNITIFSPEPSSSNSIDDFYYDTLPTRVESSKIKLDSLTLLDNTLIHKTRRVVNVFTPYDSVITSYSIHYTKLYDLCLNSSFGRNTINSTDNGSKSSI